MGLSIIFYIFSIILLTSSVALTAINMYNVVPIVRGPFRGNAFAQSVTTPLPKLRDTSLKLELVTDKLLTPTSMAFVDNNGTLLVLQKNDGKVMVIDTLKGVIRDSPTIQVPVNGDRERGLLGIAVMAKNNGLSSNIKNSTTTIPLYRNNNSNSDNKSTKFVFLYFTESNGKDPIKNRIYRYEWDAQNKTLFNPKLILELPALPPSIHNGGKLEADLSGRYLFAVIGDQNTRGILQNIIEGAGLANDTSVIFRITQNGSAPKTNPFYNTTNMKEVWKYYAYGVRNSFGLAIDPLTGTLWDTENGSDRYDEMNVVHPGFNSGWKKVMGPISRNITSTAKNETNQTSSHYYYPFLVYLPGSHYTDPVFSWKETVAPTDIEFLNSTKLGVKYAYDIFVGDFKNGNLYHFELNKNRTDIELGNLTGALRDRVADNSQELSGIIFGSGFTGGITDIETGPDGYLYVLTLDGKLFRILPVHEQQ